MKLEIKDKIKEEKTSKENNYNLFTSFTRTIIYSYYLSSIMNWTKLIYVLIIVLLYIPMVFLGANVFFPKYTGQNAHFYDYKQCYPYPSDKITSEQQAEIDQKQLQCQKDQQQAQQTFEEQKQQYESQKYIFVTIFNLLILSLALFLPMLQDSVSMGLFVGSIATTFGATIRFFDTNSKIGFIILVITFFAMLYFINRKKDTFVDWKGKK